MTTHEPDAPNGPTDATATHPVEEATAAPAPTLPRNKRKRPLHTLSLSPDGWDRLDNLAPLGPLPQRRRRTTDSGSHNA